LSVRDFGRLLIGCTNEFLGDRLKIAAEIGSFVLIIFARLGEDDIRALRPGVETLKSQGLSHIRHAQGGDGVKGRSQESDVRGIEVRLAGPDFYVIRNEAYGLINETPQLRHQPRFVTFKMRLLPVYQGDKLGLCQRAGP